MIVNDSGRGPWLFASRWWRPSNLRKQVEPPTASRASGFLLQRARTNSRGAATHSGETLAQDSSRSTRVRRELERWGILAGFRAQGLKGSQKCKSSRGSRGSRFEGPEDGPVSGEEDAVQEPFEFFVARFGHPVVFGPGAHGIAVPEQLRRSATFERRQQRHGFRGSPLLVDLPAASDLSSILPSPGAADFGLRARAWSGWDNADLENDPASPEFDAARIRALGDRAPRAVRAFSACRARVRRSSR